MTRYLSLVLVTAVVSSACFKVSTTPTSTSQMLGGTWVSVESVPGGSLAESCTNFKWAVTEFTGTTAKGTFSARCFGNTDIAGSAQGTLSTASSVTWSAAATGTVAGQPPCSIALSGTATLEADRIRIPYTGTTCLGSVSGTEIIKK